MNQTPFYAEHRNKNAGRAFPFCERLGGPVDSRGRRLPPDAVVDAAVLCLSTSGDTAVRSIDFSARTVTAVAGGVPVTGAWTDEDPVVRLAEDDTHARSAGCLVMGPRARAMAGLWEFTGTAGELDAGALICAPADCVRGVLMANNDLCYGPITFVSGVGVRTISYVDGVTGQARLRVDAVGATEAPAQCETCAPIRCIRIETVGASMVAATRIGPGVGALDTPTLDLEQICAGRASPLRARVQPCAEDEDPGGEGGPADCADELELPPDSNILLCPTGGQIQITTPSSPGHGNPLHLQTQYLPTPGVYSGVRGVVAGDIRSLERRLAVTQDPAAEARWTLDLRLGLHAAGSPSGRVNDR